jgi:hypothetical protein
VSFVTFFFRAPLNFTEAAGGVKQTLNSWVNALG